MFPSRLLAVAALVLVHPQEPSAAMRSWPGAGACSGTLQACIDAAADGDVIVLDPFGPIVEDILIDGRTLTLTSHDADAPAVVGRDGSVRVRGADHDNRVVIDALRFERSSLRATHAGAGVLGLTVRRSRFESSSASTAQLGVRVLDVSGSIVLDVSENVFDVVSQSTLRVEIIDLDGQGGALTGSIARNRIEFAGNPRASLISISNDDAAIAVDIVANTLIGDTFNHGLSVFGFGDGETVIRAIDNHVRGQRDHSGAPGAISFDISSGQGRIVAVNNTLVGNDTGLAIRARVDLGAVVDGVIANNLIAFNDDRGLVIDKDLTDAVPNLRNLVHGNARDSFAPGPGTIDADPLLASLAQPLLTSSSPARDSADGAFYPLPFGRDAGGAPRLMRRLDIGAHEFRAEGEVFLSGFERP